MNLARPSFPAPGWRWIKARLWGLEHAFERAKAAGKAEDDTRIRILVVLGLFASGFLILSIGAARMALAPSGATLAAVSGPTGSARADLVDRNGAMLAADLLHYGLYIDPREIWDTAETRQALTAALPDLPAARLDRALKSDHRTFVMGALTPEVRGRLHDLGLPGVTFEPEQHRLYPLGTTAAHLVGFADTGGRGLSGAELALNDIIRSGAAEHASTPLSIDLRVQAALEDELNRAAAGFSAKGAVGIVTNVHTGEVLALASYPIFDPNIPGRSPPDAMINRAAASVYEMGSIFKVFTVAMGLDSRTACR